VKEAIHLKLDEKAVRNSNAFNWFNIAVMIFVIYCIVYGSFTTEYSKILMLIGLAWVIWIIKFLWNEIYEQNRQLRDDLTLYELTKDSFSNHYGNQHSWDEFEKVYFHKGSVRFSFLNKDSPFLIMSPTGIDRDEFAKACRFIKTHAPTNATKNFKPK